MMYLRRKVGRPQRVPVTLQLNNATGDDECRRDGWYLWCSVVIIVCCRFILFIFYK